MKGGLSLDKAVANGGTTPALGGAIGSHGGGTPPGMPTGAANQSAIHNMSAHAKAQAVESARPTAAYIQQAQNTSLEIRGASPTNPGTIHVKGATSMQEAQQYGQSLHQNGVQVDGGGHSVPGTGEKTTPSTPEGQATVQAGLDSNNKSEHNGPQQGSRCAAAQQEAASASTSSPSQSMDK